MAFLDDFSIDYVNKRITHTSGTTVYDVNTMYSALMDTFDELVQMDDPVPMSAQTPTEYTMINGWFIDDESVKYLKNGAIKTSGYKQGSPPDNPTGIRILTFQASGYVNCVPSDITKPVVGTTTGDSGVLLFYNNALRKWWVRSDAADDDFPQAEEITITGGTGAGTTIGASVTGEDLYANIYTLGTIEGSPAPQIYVFQAGARIAEWSHLSNWDRGHIDVLIKVKEAGTEIADGIVTVFARQSGDLYDNYEIDLSAGGRNAVPLSTADDLNEDTGEFYLLYDAETAAFTTIGQIITGGTSGAKAELVAVVDWGTTGRLTLRDVQGTFQDNETITGSIDGSATVNGTVGDTYLAYENETGAFTVGLVVTGGTSGAKRILRGLQDDGTTGKMVLQVDTTQTGANRTPYYKVFQDDEAITDTGGGAAVADGASTTIVSGFSDITIAFVNGTATHGGTTGTFIPGERVTWPTGQSGILLKDTGSVITLGNCTDTALNGKTITGDLSGAYCTCNQDLQSAHTMDKAFEQQSPYPYDVIVNAGDIYAAGRKLAQVYEYFKYVCQAGSTFKMFTVVDGVITILDGEEYIIAYPGYAPSKAAPFGTFAGGKYFGAQGVWIEGMASGQSYTFKDSNGILRDPYVSVVIAITNTLPGDRITVFRTSAGAIDKAMYTSHATNNDTPSTSFEVVEDIAVDTPASGIIRLRKMPAQTEERIAYTSWSGKVFTLAVAHSGGYDGDDTAYVPFIDQEATAGTVEKTVLYAVDRPVLVRARRKAPIPILPFETPATVTSAGLTVAVIRTEDTIVT